MKIKRSKKSLKIKLTNKIINFIIPKDINLGTSALSNSCRSKINAKFNNCNNSNI